MNLRSTICTAVLLCLLGTTFSLFAQDDCGNEFYPFKVGTIYEMTYFDDRDTMTSRVQYIVQNIDPGDDGSLDAMVSTMMYDERGKELMDGVFDVYCTKGVIKLDLSTYFSPASMEAFRDMELEMSGEGLEIPQFLEEGQHLKDGNMSIKVGTPGGASMTLTIVITNRTVKGLETITTNAGSFLCYKITQDTELTIGAKRKQKTIEYYSKGVGLVRTETFDEATGKRTAHADMTRFN